ncbi:MAG: NAD-dependent epimerase/dehydratase family protein, partial [Candidatus Gastranaerophilales bacterium]|nr:NAD-dependent epimerase/dehydratase family protein [Candidatus Gastranaerophilales bacterium]
MAQNEVDNKVWQEDLNLLAKDEIFKSFSNSSILITGATGLIGSELVFSILCANRLNNLNIKIYALVRNENKAKEIFKNVLDNPNFNLIIQDITSNIQIEEKIDYVIHCANITNSKIMVEKPAEVVDVTINGIKNVLEFAKKNDIKSVLYLSSIEIYGENVSNKIDIKEDDYGVDVKIARLTQTFGAGISKDENRIFAQIAKAIIKNEDIVLKTDGLSAKNYCYITDTISALLTI